MKKFTASIIAVVILITLLGSCVSLQDRQITVQERAEISTLGTTTVQFQQFRLLHFFGDDSIKSKAYTQLLAEARRQYGNDVEVRNIQINGGFSGMELLYSIGTFAVPIGIGLALADPDYPEDAFSFGMPVGLVLNVLGHFEKITATADIVRAGAGPAVRPTGSDVNFDALEAALDKASGTLIDAMPRGTTLAILNVSSSDQIAARYVLDELEYKLVLANRFQIVDRRQLEQIRAEQNFQISGEVDDSSAVSIGNMLGATIVITGDISSYGNSQRLSLRALDVRTARILTIAREQF